MKHQKDTPKPPGRLGMAARRHARTVRPYLITVAATEAFAITVTALLGFPLTAGILLGAGVGVGVTGQHAGTRLWEAIGYRRAGGRRAARQRRRYQGLASGPELWRHLSLRTARQRAKVTRPQTPGRLPAPEAGVQVGKAGPLRRPVAVTHEDAVLVIGIPRVGKSAAFGNWIWDAPGAALVTTTRTDMYLNTAVPRRAHGPVLVLNPSGDGGLPSTLRWSPLDGCHTAAGAITAAGYLTAAAPQDKDKDAFWMQQAHTLLRLYMHAAILDGASILDVRDWISDPASLEALTILENHPLAVPGWANELAAIQLGTIRDAVASGVVADGNVTDSQQSVQSTALSTLAWLSDPAMAAAVCASPAEWFDAEEFIKDGGTVYLIGADRPHNSLGPFFASFTGHVFETAKRLAAASPGARLDPPLTLALDEAAIICPVPLDRWSAEAGGHGITLLAAVQSPSQLKDRWGEHGADTIWNNMSKLIFGGLSLAKDLEDISSACGDRDTWEHVKGESGKKTRQPGKERTVLPERIRKMTPGTALFLHRGVRPFFASLTPVWERPGYTKATVHPAAELVPHDTTVTTPALSSLTQAALCGPTIPAVAATPAAAVQATLIHPAIEEAPHGR